MSGYVVCPACGTRIKAGREHCLKCFEPLPHPDAPVRVPLSESLGLSEQGQMVVGGAALAIVLGLIYVIWTSEAPTPQEPMVVSRVERSTAAAPAAGATPAPATATDAAPAAGASAGAAGDSAPPMPPIPAAVTHDPDADVDPALDQQRQQYLAQLERTPKDGATHNKLGLVLAQMGRNDEALKEFDLAIAASPRDPSYRVNFANLALATGEWGRAINQYRESVLLARTDFAAQFGLAVALQRKGDHELAVAEFLKARHLNADAHLVAMGLGASYERLGRHADALREYRDFLKLQPNSPEADRVRVYLATLR